MYLPDITTAMIYDMEVRLNISRPLGHSMVASLGKNKYSGCFPECKTAKLTTDIRLLPRLMNGAISPLSHKSLSIFVVQCVIKHRDNFTGTMCHNMVPIICV